MKAIALIFLVFNAAAARGATADVPVVDPAVNGKAVQAQVGSEGTAAKTEASAGGAIVAGACMKAGKATGAVSSQQCRRDGGTWHATTMRQRPLAAPQTETSGGAPTGLAH